LRKLAERRRKAETIDTKRDMIAEYSNYGSNLYAPKMRDGLKVKKVYEPPSKNNEIIKQIDMNNSSSLNKAMEFLETLEYKKPHEYQLNPFSTSALKVNYLITDTGKKTTRTIDIH
jgi:hypothetical protein